ncbi:hypothetical protein [Luteolibacter sp. Populi]|uniref:hypothetical protein n=1 Tax=Luteolibacter sp. Populi TaxID=3230487 RepID=UPI0034654D60
MRATLLWLIPAAAFLSACDKQEEPAAARSKLKAPKPGTHRPETTPEAQASEKTPETSAPAADSGSFTTPQSSPVAPASQASAPATPPTILTQEQRDAYSAEQRAKRATQMAETMATRFKEQDANGDGLLAQGEVSERMQRGFTRADTNGDGSLDATEQQTLIKNMSERMTGNNPRDRRETAGRRGQGGNRRGRN